MKNILVIFILALLYGLSEADQNATFKVPEYIIPCARTDVNINKCLVNTFNHLRPYLKEGISEIDVPSIEPLHIDNLIMDNGRGPVRVKASFFNISTSGASNYSVSGINADLKNYIIELRVLLPKIEVKGKYDVDGNVLLLPVKSKGEFWAVFLDVTGVGRIFGKEFFDENKIAFMEVDKMLVDFRLKKSRFRIKDVYNDGNIIGEAMNQFLNNNADEIIKEMRPAANLAIAKHFKGFLNKAFVKLPMKVWLPDA